MLRAASMAWMSLRRLVYASIPKTAGAPFSGILIRRLRPTVVASVSRHYARMRNRSPPTPKEVESDSDSSSSDNEELMDPYRENNSESEELECFVLDFGAGEEEEEKHGGGEDG